MEAAQNGYTEVSGCEYEVNDSWDKQFVEGCVDYVKLKKRRASAYS